MVLLERPYDAVGAVEADAEELDLVVGDQIVVRTVEKQRGSRSIVLILKSRTGEDSAGEGDDAGVAEVFREELLSQVGAVAALEVALERGNGPMAPALLPIRTTCPGSTVSSEA